MSVMMNLKFQLFEKKTINQENLKFNYTPKINSYLVIKQELNKPVNIHGLSIRQLFQNKMKK